MSQLITDVDRQDHYRHTYGELKKQIISFELDVKIVRKVRIPELDQKIKRTKGKLVESLKVERKQWEDYIKEKERAIENSEKFLELVHSLIK